MHTRRFALLCAMAMAAYPATLVGAESSKATNDPIARIRDEGMNRPQVMQTLSYLTDVIGPRLTGSPHMKQANEWTQQKLAAWGLSNAHQETWGPFGRGWSLKRFSAQVVAPYSFPIAAFPKAWSPGLNQPVMAKVIYLKSGSAAELEQYKGKLKGAIVLNGAARKMEPRFDAPTVRLEGANLLQIANATDNQRFVAATPSGRSSSRGSVIITNRPAASAASTNVVAASRTRTNEPPVRPLEFLIKEGTAMLVTPSRSGDGGTLFVESASVPRRGSSQVSAYATNAPATLPQMAMANEDYNRLVRMLEQGVDVKMAVEFEAAFNDDGLMPANTIAEIPGGDLKDEIVMIGGHMDSWHSGTGATDNGAGVAVAMEAARIIKALDLKPRRTIRIALWSGEEQGLLGSAAYVSRHFGYYTNSTNVIARSPRAESNESPARLAAARSSQRKLVRQSDYEKLSAYYNLDNGAGRIRGIFLQGNDAARPLFRRWLQPFNDLGAETLSSGQTMATDHLSFHSIGLPGFQFIQDPLDYFTRTHHSNADVYDRVPEEDMKQASVIMAAFLYNTAMENERIPRRQLNEESPGTTRRAVPGIAAN